MLFLEQIISGLAIGSVYSLLGLGFTMIFACTRRINFAHGDIMVLGGFLGLVFFKIFPSYPIISYVLCPLTIGIISVLIERILLRPLQEVQPLKIVISTIGLSIILKIVMQMIWGPDALPYPKFISAKPIELFNVRIDPQILLIFFVGLCLMILLQSFFNYSKPGRALRALSQDRYAARLMGVKVGQGISLTYFISGTLAGIAGMLLAPVYFISSTMGTMLGLKSFVAAVIGGLGNIPGTIIAGFFLGVVENLTSGFISSAYKNGISLIFLVLVLLFRPEGLLSNFSLGLFKKRKQER